MSQNQTNKKNLIHACIIFLSIIGLLACITLLFPQARQMLLDLAEQALHKESSNYQTWFQTLLSYAIGGICFILLFDYCTLTTSGRKLADSVKQEIRDCLSEIDFRAFLKPILLMSGIFLLGIFTIIRANFSYLDDMGRAVGGYRMWHIWSRYISEFSSIFIHGDIILTDISPLTQLLAVIILSLSSVLLVYVLSNRKITMMKLLASIALGLSPYFLECLSYKFDAPYMALSILACIIPFLFITRKKAFFFCSVVSLLVMCMTYQSVSGVYLLITILICFQDWNSRTKPDKEILSFFGIAVMAFCSAMVIFRFFLMKPYDDYNVSTAIHPLPQVLPGVISNIKDYAIIINNDLGMTWKIGIILVSFLFVTKSVSVSIHKKLFPFFISIIIVCISFVLSYGMYILLAEPMFHPRAIIGSSVFLSIFCIYIVSDYKKIAKIIVLALNWCFLIFAFSYGNALADQARYAEFRIGILLHDLNALYPVLNEENMLIQLSNSIEFAPSIKNISKHYPVIEKLVPKRLTRDYYWDGFYLLNHFSFGLRVENLIDFNTLNMPIVLDSYYHTIKSDGKRILVELKH